jgi:hypothetical protein
VLRRDTRRQFGNVAAAYVLQDLAGFRQEPLPVKWVWTPRSSRDCETLTLGGDHAGLAPS